jgi:hypothetical protein
MEQPEQQPIPVNETARKIASLVVNKIFKDWDKKVHRPTTLDEANANLDDAIEIELIIRRMIQRINLTITEAN